jgi:hypothetical protein
MQRVTQAALIGLTIAIVLTVGSLVWRAVSFDQHMPVLEAVDPAIGHAFYDGINQVLAGTSTDALEAVVSPGFVDHGGDRHGDRSATKLVEELSAFRQSFPNTRVVVNGIESATGTLVASIAPVEPSGALVAGLPLTMKPLAGGYEVLRVQNGRVTERWSAGLPDIELWTIEEAGFRIGATSNGSTRLDRIELVAASSVKLTVQGQSVVMVESGSVRVDIQTASQSSIVKLETGQAVHLPGGSRIKLERAGNTTARLLRYSVQAVVPTEPAPPEFSGSTSSSVLWTSNLPSIENGLWTISIGTLQLPTGAQGQLGEPEGGALVVYSESGSLRLETRDGAIAKLDEQLWPSVAGTSVSISAGQAANIQETDLINLRSESGDTIWVISIVPSVALMPAASPVSGGSFAAF